ncbi:hypothetical protein WN51_05114 [Melipona quadrifasciata]|uniref:Uncharacterized protein n=1 Tax=Melipona quadrifasciata TaxID=166423 RepID=A0A0M8ZRD0_9HYME|nr:hypothetical protein WN51_05114 [Melipona quadrifasciata]
MNTLGLRCCDDKVMEWYNDTIGKGSKNKTMNSTCKDCGKFRKIVELQKKFKKKEKSESNVIGTRFEEQMPTDYSSPLGVTEKQEKRADRKRRAEGKRIRRKGRADNKVTADGANKQKKENRTSEFPERYTATANLQHVRINMVVTQKGKMGVVSIVMVICIDRLCEFKNGEELFHKGMKQDETL